VLETVATGTLVLRTIDRDDDDHDSDDDNDDDDESDNDADGDIRDDEYYE